MFRLLFSRPWWYATLLVIAAVAVMARLGLWQLDRLADRRAFNARVSEQMAAPTLDLNDSRTDVRLTEMEYRTVTVVGEYDHAQQVALRNQAYNNHNGIRLLTPLIVAGTQPAVLVDRGWIPLEDSAPENWVKYDEPGTVQVRGVIRLSQAKADFGSIADPEGELKLWNLANVARIDAQVSYPLLPVYVQQAPAESSIAVGEEAALISAIFPSENGDMLSSDRAVEAQLTTPVRIRPEIDLSEGPHLGYAIQWFAFAAVLAIGYPRYVSQNSRAEATGSREHSSCHAAPSEVRRQKSRPEGAPTGVE